MDALAVETRIAEGEQALQVPRPFARESAGTLAAHEAAKGLFTRRRPRGWAAMKRYFAQRGTGEIGPAIVRADGVVLPREPTLRGRASCARLGTFAVARTCDRRPGAPGIVPLDAQVNLPARGSADFRPEWRTAFAVEHPVRARVGCFAPLCALAVAESVLRAGAQEASEDDAGFEAPRPVPHEAPAGALRVVRGEGTGVPMIQAAAVQRKAQLGTGEKRHQKQAALVGVCYPVAAQPRSPGALAELVVDPAAARARQQRPGGQEDWPSAPQVRRLASLVRTPQAVRARLKADAERRAPQHRNPVVVRRDGALGLWRLATTRCQAWRHVVRYGRRRGAGHVTLGNSSRGCCRTLSPCGMHTATATCQRSRPQPKPWTLS